MISTITSTILTTTKVKNWGKISDYIQNVYYAMSCDLSPKNLLIASNSHSKSRFCKSSPLAGFYKTDFVVSSAFGAGNNKIIDCTA
jgi:hypothetical protein